MSGHTPGPWKQHPDYPWIIKEDNAPISEDGVSICNTTGHPNSGFFPTPSKALANARLIAAAPDLLEALSKFVEFAEQNGEVVFAGGGMPVIDAMNACTTKARAAIAKAAGGQS